MITITQQPQAYSPVNNPVVFQITSNVSELTYFMVEVLSEGNTLIAKQKYYTLPTINNGTYFDLSSILKNYVNYELVNSQNIVEPLSKSILTYKLSITEYVYDGNAVMVNDNLQTGPFEIWNAELSLTSFTNYDYNDFVLTSNTTVTRFLINKPLISNIYSDSTNYLYVLNDGTNSTVKVNFYGTNNLLLGSQSLPLISSSDKAIQLNISPSVLDLAFGVNFNNIYGDEFQSPFGIQFGDFDDIYSSNYYTVQIVDSNGNPKSELRTYILKNVGCSTNHFELIYSNNFGGFDSVTLFNSKETITVNKTTIENYPYKIDSNGLYSNIRGGIYNNSNTVINSTALSTYKAITDVLSDAQSRAVKDIIKAERVYLRLGNGDMLPVSLSTSTYNVQLKRYSSNNIRVEIEFTSNVSGLFD
jgi:hypothetical protein